ncbi:phosphate acyltransferase [Enterocloster citroniae]|uniref:Phosphate acetyl/butaryl transferase domain-containing protein n=1 Tax=[Clostridium] citroniae WAL-17108 TaxID=742733 RepID=G5HJZ6_9FIRM|nr:phosphate acyltransferase [Enterocloster citroniae]EHE98257.1 hypothetical protein HMPREF9469_02908 [ [[Clostridium] citroniae WAL-17108]MCC3385236.1 phosphate acetyltransferase [Enterocloster citroniae]
MDMIKQLEKKLKWKQRKVIFVECLDNRILEACRYLVDNEICKPILLGKPEEIIENADNLKIDIEGISVFNSENMELREYYAKQYNNMNPDFSERRLIKKMNHPLFYAAILVKVEYADCLAAGVLYSTGDVILAAQQFIGIQNHINTISSIGYQMIELGDERCIGVSDCAVSTNPTAEELADIAITSAQSYQNAIGQTAKVAMISYSTQGSGEGESVDKVRQSIEIAHQKVPDLLIEGEYQIDSALLPDIAARKVKGNHQVAGQANVLIFPNLDAGNIAVKCMQIFGRKQAFGPILQGFQRPVTDFSRAAKTKDVIGNIILCMLQGEEYEDIGD